MIGAFIKSYTTFRLGALFGLFGVGLSAFGAHGLKKRTQDESKLKNWNTASSYMMFHAPALILLSIMPYRSNAAKFAALGISTGVCLFSGSIFGLVLTDSEKHRKLRKVLGPITPIGGLLIMAGWGALLLI